jgi:hypothetical protein
MIRADSSAISVPRFSRPDYYTTSLSVCQEVFEKFFKNFCGIFRSQLAAVFVAARCQLAYYSTFVFICQAVFCKFFRFGDDSSMS